MTDRMVRYRLASLLSLVSFLFLSVLAMPVAADELPAPDGKEADLSKPVKVFILMGQSNMVGFGKTADLKTAAETGLYPYLVDDAGAWTVRNDVRNVRVMCSGSNPWKTHFNDWLSGSNGSGAKGGKFGPEIGIGFHLGHFFDEPVLILKSCIGNRSLGYDLLPPSAVGTGVGDKSYEGNKDDPARTPKEGGWYAGVQYDGDTRAAKEVLKDLGTYYPGAKEFEVAGFFFWQGAKDLGKGGRADTYETNLVHLINDLRKDFNAPDAPFVCATMGQAKKGNTITDAQLAVDGRSGKYPQFKNNVATFYSNPVSKGGGANGHYGGNAQTYMNVGVGMGKEMVRLFKDGAGDAGKDKDEKADEPAEPIDHQLREWTGTNGKAFKAKFIEASRGKVVLELENGRKRQYSKRSFIEEDIAYIEKYAR